MWGISAVGSAQHSHCWGQGFDSPMLHHFSFYPESCPSGRRCSTRNAVWGNSPRVRIPNSPPLLRAGKWRFSGSFLFSPMGFWVDFGSTFRCSALGFRQNRYKIRLLICKKCTKISLFPVATGSSFVFWFEWIELWKFCLNALRS